MAATILDAINEAPPNVANASVNNGIDLSVQLTAWIDGVFVNPSVDLWNDLDQRRDRLVLDWHGPSLIALSEIPSGVATTDETHARRALDVVNRVLWAFQIGIQDGTLDAGAEAPIVTLFNATWPP